jgi:hypothetical protein
VSSIDAITGSNEETTTLVGYLPLGESLAPDRHRVVVDWLTPTPTPTLTREVQMIGRILSVSIR